MWEGAGIKGRALLLPSDVLRPHSQKDPSPQRTQKEAKRGKERETDVAEEVTNSEIRKEGRDIERDGLEVFCLRSA